jgi:predicted metal-binding membrane protein
MSIFWMALLALMIFVEKLFAGRAALGISFGLGGIMAAVGASFFLFPDWGAWALGIP